MHYFVGIVVILIGLLLLGNNLGMTEVSIGELVRIYWPVLFLYWGANILLRSFSKKEKGEVTSHWSMGEVISGIILLILGGILLGNNMGLLEVDLSFFWKVFWPVVLIIVGVSFLRGKTVSGNKRNMAVMGGVELGKKAPIDLKSESYWAVMGGVELDLTDANIPEGETVLDMTAVMGGIEVTIPEDLPVICQGTVVMGGIEFLGEGTGGIISGKSMSYKVTEDTKTYIRIQARAFMGGIEVKKR